MLKRVFLRIILIIICVCFLFPGCRSQKARITVDYRKGINYVAHIYTLAGIGFHDSSYVAECGESISAGDLDTLINYTSSLEFANGQSGQLAQFFFFIPAYADLDSRTEYENYLKDIETAVKDKSGSSLLKYFPGYKHEFLNDLCKKNESGNSKLGDLMPGLKSVMQVYINNIDEYFSEVYPQVEPLLAERAEEYNSRLEGNGLIEKWMDCTSYNWDKGDYTYLLFAAGHHGPSFNNLSGNSNSLYYDLDTDYTLDMFSHEFGIFLTFDSIMNKYMEFGRLYPVYESNYTLGNVNWMAYEMLITYFNCRVNNRTTNDYYEYVHSDPLAFMEIYDDLYTSGVTEPLEMYSEAVTTYMDPVNGYWKSGVEERYNSFIRGKTSN